MALSSTELELLAKNLEQVRARIARACAAAGRASDEVTLVAVTKYAGPAYAAGLVELGQLDLGENRVGHLCELAEALGPGPRWHMIGHLQGNKAARVSSILHALHSLDSAKLARRLSDQRDAALPPLEVYLQLSLSEDEGRSGVPAADLDALWEEVGTLTGLRRLGLMGLPPMGDAQEARPHFRRVAAEAERLGARGLSMGMTADLEVAIAEGATVVRVGRALREGLSG